MRRTLTLALAGLLLFWWTPPARAQSALPTFPRDDTGEVAPPAVRYDGTGYRSGVSVSLPVALEGDLLSDPGYATTWTTAQFVGGTLATWALPVALADNRILAISAHDTVNTQMRVWASTDLGRTFVPISDSGAITPAAFNRPTAATATQSGVVLVGFSCNLTAAPGCSALTRYAAQTFTALALPAALNGGMWVAVSMLSAGGTTLALLQPVGGGVQQVCRITFAQTTQAATITCAAAGTALAMGAEHPHRFFTTGNGTWFVTADDFGGMRLYRSVDDGVTWAVVGGVGVFGDTTAPSWCDRPSGPCWTWAAGGQRLVRITNPSGALGAELYGGTFVTARTGGARAPNGRIYTVDPTVLSETTMQAQGPLTHPLATLPVAANAVGAASPSVVLLGRGPHATERLLVSRVVVSGGTLGSFGSPSTASCKTTTVNALGAAGADVTIDGTAGGIATLAADPTRCGALLRNAGAADMRCAPTGLTPTATAGFLVPPGMTLVLGAEGQQAWRCIRTTGTSTAATTAEERP